MTEHESARQWRLDHGWTLEQFSELTGYSRSAIIWFERGRGPRGQPIDEFSWYRFRRICHSIAMSEELQFNWGAQACPPS